MNSLPPFLAQVVADVRLKQVVKGQIIFYAGDISPDVYVLKSGIIKIYDIDHDGNEKILHLLKTPGIIPFAFFSGITVATRWFYTALTDCEVYVVPRLKLLGEIRTNSALGIYLMNWLSIENHEILARLSSLGKSNAKDKLIAALTFLVRWHGIDRRGKWRRITFPINHQLLADMTGLTRESTAAIMKQLEKERIVRYPRVAVLEIHQQRLLEIAAER